MDVAAAVPVGDVSGAAVSALGPMIPNPYSGDAQAVVRGHDLFISMNCAGCHGYGAGGGMGPQLVDTYWRYGGTPVSIFKSIYEGRPKGMPAWNPALPPEDIWKLVAYIEQLGGAFPASDYLAALQGDRAGENVAPEVRAAGAVPAADPDPAVPATAAPSSAPAVPTPGDSR